MRALIGSPIEFGKLTVSPVLAMTIAGLPGNDAAWAAGCILSVTGSAPRIDDDLDRVRARRQIRERVCNAVQPDRAADHRRDVDQSLGDMMQRLSERSA